METTDDLKKKIDDLPNVISNTIIKEMDAVRQVIASQTFFFEKLSKSFQKSFQKIQKFSFFFFLFLTRLIQSKF